MLDYQNQMFTELLADDGLIIAARGLGVLRIVTALIQVHCDPGNLVLVINTFKDEQDIIIRNLEIAGVTHLPQAVTNTLSAQDRHQRYLDGGVLFVTSRILVVDILKENVPTDLVKGIIVNNAHRVDDTCLEAFILRLYREQNKEGFIKALSEKPHMFSSGFFKVERVMKNLFVRHLYLWPRFHASVASSLEKRQPEVIELHPKMTPSMLVIQTAILDLLRACLSEMRKTCSGVEADVFTTEMALTRTFDSLLRTQLDPISHQLSGKSRQLASDVSTLRTLLSYLTQYDCVTFYHFLAAFRSQAVMASSSCHWVILDAADVLFKHAKERVFGRTERDADSSRETAEENLKLEENPKWHILSDVMAEIENANASSDLGPARTLVIASDARACALLRQYLCVGGRQLLLGLYRRLIQPSHSASDGSASRGARKRRSAGQGGGRGKRHSMRSAESSTSSARGGSRGRGRGRSRGRGRGRGQAQATVDVSKPGNKESEESSDATSGAAELDSDDKLGSLEQEDDDLDFDENFGIVSDSLVIVHQLKGNSDAVAAGRVLQEVEPRFVVLFDIEMEFVRQIEIFKASRPGLPLRVYFLAYASSVEEQRYLTSLRKEKEAFELLIKQKTTMAISEDQEGRSADSAVLSRDPKPASETVASTRKGGGKDEATARKVVVDMREFRSSLPSLIHRRGINIEPVTLEVGDYILSPDMCVERKSLNDLVDSLSSGRLYNQAMAMTRHYKRAMLLIEFSEKQSFSIHARGSLQNEISFQDLSSKLSLLTLHFPQLRILWCQTPYATAELFDELKEDQPEPEAEAAAKVSSEDGLSSTDGAHYHPLTQDFVSKMPGIHSKNISSILKRVPNLLELCKLSRAEIADVLGHVPNARLLHDFLHSKPSSTSS